MKQGIRSWVGRAACGVLLSLLASIPALGGGGVEAYSLTKAIPADAVVAIHTRSHDGQKFVNEQFARVWAELEAVRLDRDVKRAFKAMAEQNGTTAEAFDAQWQQVVDLCNAVEWSQLSAREYAMGLKLTPLPEIVTLMMPPADQVQSIFDGLSGVAQTLVKLTGEQLTLTTEGEGASVIHRVTPVGAPIPLQLVVAREKDVIFVAVGAGSSLFEQSLALLRGEEGKVLAKDERFKAALADLPEGKDALTFVDLSRLMGQVRALMDQAIAMGAPGEGAPEAQIAEFNKVKALPEKLIGALDMFETVASATTTEGMKSTTTSITRLQEDAGKRGFYPVVFGNKPLAEPLKHVPVQAENFSVGSGIDLQALWKLALDFLKNDVPEGEMAVAQLNEAAAGVNLNIETDIVGWLQGGYVSFGIPGATSFSPSEWAFLLQVRDEAKAREMIGRLVDLVGPMLAQQQGQVVDAELEGTEGFKSFVVPQLVMFGLNKPTLGVKDGWLFVGSSAETIGKSLETAAGKNKSIAENDRFKAEGLSPKGETLEVSFSDMTKWGEQIGQVLMMAPMMQMAMGEGAKEPAVQALFGMIGKLGRVMRKFDFFQSMATMSTFDGKQTVTMTVMNYRMPEVPKATDEKPAGASAGEPKP